MPKAFPVRRLARALSGAPAALCSLAALSGALQTAHAQTTSPQVEVIGTSPLPGQGVARDTLPYGTQVLRRAALDEAQADTATDFLARRVPGVQVNDIQGSPFQGDLTFRGYRASGILGAAQGVSVYVDGVRFNEPFGDVVNWDMVPEFALQSISLVPGANPAFGLNTLGGALSLVTANGLSAPGLRGEFSAGRFGRVKGELSFGARDEDGWHHYLGVGAFDEQGWRDHSAGRTGQLLAKLGRQWGDEDLSLSVLAGSSRLVGNGLVPWATLEDDGSQTPDLGQTRRSAVYTHPDETRNQLTQLGLQWRHQLADGSLLEALAYARDSRRRTVNGDEADDPAPGEPNAALNQTATRQRSGGGALAWSGRRGPHQWQLGATLDQAAVHYQQTERAGSFDPSRGVVPVAGEDAELSARVSGHSTALGVYASDTWALQPGTHLTATLRLNHARVRNTLGSLDDDTGVFEQHARESFRYDSINPAIGIAQQLGGGFTAFANVARNNRVPTVIELGCADPEQPCRLPAGLQADPYLKQVVSVGVEGGLRWKVAGGLEGSVTAYRNDNRDDILFRSTSVTGQLGYFANFPRTRHQGLDLESQWRTGDWSLGLGASWLDATYQAHGVLRMGERNVTITPGTRIAGLPRQQLKLAADWRAGGGWSLGADLQGLSSRTVAGNEDGLLEDGAAERVRLTLPAYALVHLRAAFKPAGWQGLELFGRVSNLFDRLSASFGALAATRFDAQGAYTGTEQEALFVAPGAPRAFQVGLRVQL